MGKTFDSEIVTKNAMSKYPGVLFSMRPKQFRAFLRYVMVMITLSFHIKELRMKR